MLLIVNHNILRYTTKVTTIFRTVVWQLKLSNVFLFDLLFFAHKVYRFHSHSIKCSTLNIQ